MDVSRWLWDLGLGDYIQAFQVNHIDAEVLPRLTADDLTAIGITSVGHRRRLLDAIALLNNGTQPAAAEAIDAIMRPAAAERRQLTVLFCDLVGSTELATRLDPEDLREVMGAYHRRTAAVIERFEGHVAKYLGDGLLAYFGWLRAHEDDAERAVRAGLELVEADLGPRRLKGFAEPLSVWQVSGEGRAEGRFEALHGEHLTPLVGREHELGILLERWDWAKGGDGQVVLLSGEPGIGKSRMIRALRERLCDASFTPLSHYCSPYHTNSALYPVIGLLERATRLDRDEPPVGQLAGLEAVLGRSSERLDEVVPLFAALLGVPTGKRYPALILTPEVQKRRTLQALVDQLEGLAVQRPVLALYEDVHWIDPSTLELLGLVIERIQRLPVLVLITFRPEFQPPWSGQAHVSTLPMSRLGRRQGGTLWCASRVARRYRRRSSSRSWRAPTACRCSSRS